MQDTPSAPVRTFASGATRDQDGTKPDYEGFLSPLVLEAYGAYMHKHRKQSDGSLRASDNWQKGIPQEQYLKSLWRHFFNVWKFHRGGSIPETIEDAACGVMFNIMGWFHEHLKARQNGRTGAPSGGSVGASGNSGSGSQL